MRIVHLLLTSRFAGTERHVLDLAAAQAAEGHEVTLVLRRKAAQSRPDAIAHRVDPRVKVELVADWLFRWPARRDAARLVRRLRPDVAHAHLGSACRALHGLEGVCLRVATLHIAYKPHHHDGLDGLIAIAPWQLPAVPAPLRAHSTQIDNWTVPRPPADGARERIRALHGIAPDEFLFGALGRVEGSKGFDVLVDAFARAAIPGARLAIVGQGKAWKSLRRQAPAEVVMPGFADRPEDWLAAFDCFVSPSRFEPFGLVLLEAMQAGLPVVASASEGARHLAPYFEQPPVPVGDAAALADALVAMHARGRRRCGYPMSHFRVEAKCAEVEAFYREGLARLGR